MRKPKIGLALGGGAFRGIAHIGVLDVFEKEDIAFDLIAGTSMGALIGSIYVSGRSVVEIEEYAVNLNERQIIDLAIPRSGILAGKRIQSIVEELTYGKTFDETTMPFAAVACDFETSEQLILREGPLHEAVRASISIPAVFTPVESNGRILVDGGMGGRVPADVCRSMGADIVIGVDVGYRGQPVRPNNLVEQIMHAIDILEWQIARQHVSEADLVIAPEVYDFNPARLGGRAAECVERGRVAAREALPDIRALLEKWENEAG